MKKGLKVIGVIVAIIVILIIVAFTAVGNAADADEYTFGSDSIKSVKSIVEKRTVTSVSTEISDGVTTKELQYESDTVFEDLLSYTTYLRGEEGGFVLIADMDLNVTPGKVELGKESSEQGQIILMTIDYDSTGYIITIQKGEGELEFY